MKKFNEPVIEVIEFAAVEVATKLSDGGLIQNGVDVVDPNLPNFQD